MIVEMIPYCVAFIVIPAIPFLVFLLNERRHRWRRQF
jgi:hypothetical protein